MHPAVQASPVGLQGLLTGAPSGPAETTGLLGQRLASPLEAGGQVAQLGQLHLRLALLAVGVLSEDVQDHRSSVDGGAAQQLLQVELLRRAELIVEDHRVAVGCLGHATDLVGLALAHIGGRIGRVAALREATDHVGTRRVHQQLQLVEGVIDVVIGPIGDDGHQQDALAEGALDQPPRLAAILAETAAVGFDALVGHGVTTSAT